MHNAMIFATSLALGGIVALQASAQPNLQDGRGRFPVSGVPGPDIPRSHPGIGPVQLQPSINPDLRPFSRWERPSIPFQNVRPANAPRANAFGQPVPQLRGIPPAPALHPLAIENDRNKENEFAIGRVIPHVLLRDHPLSFKPVSPSEFSSASGRWGGRTGGGLLAAIGAAIASLFSSFFRRNKDK